MTHCPDLPGDRLALGQEGLGTAIIAAKNGKEMGLCLTMGELMTGKPHHVLCQREACTEHRQNEAEQNGSIRTRGLRAKTIQAAAARGYMWALELMVLCRCKPQSSNKAEPFTYMGTLMGTGPKLVLCTRVVPVHLLLPMGQGGVVSPPPVLHSCRCR